MKAGRWGPGTWALAALLLASNITLSYLPLPYGPKGILVFGGILAPFLLFLLLPPPTPLESDPLEGPVGGIPPAFLCLSFALAVLLRFARLTQVSLWLTGDEALHGFLAIGLAQKWTWQFFYTVGEHPPLLIWGLALFFKEFQSPFFNLWFLPAFFSVLTIPTGFCLACRFHCRAFALLFAFLLAFSFWPLAAGRFCHQGLFLPFWELSCLLGLVFWREAATPPAARKWATLLGLWAGLGTLTFTSWWVVLFLLAVTVGYLYWQKTLKNASWFAAALLMGLSPFLAAIFFEGYGHHLLDSSIGAGWFSSAHQWVTHASYLTCLFWGPLEPDASYGPCWGGMLNPVLATCFFIGLADLWSNRRQAPCAWLLLALTGCLAPAFLAGDYVELNRIIQVMPLLIWVSLLGLRRMAGEFQGPSLRRGFLAVLLAASTVLDLNHYFMPLYRQWSSPFHPGPAVLNENFRAYQILRETYREKGPGVLLTGFLPLKYGHSLYVATDSFNASDNPRFPAGQATWACLATNVDYVPFLSSRLPGAQWYWFGSGAPGAEGGLSIGLVPVTGSNRALLDHWREAEALFHQLSLEAERVFNSPEVFQQSLRDVFKIYPWVQGDPFLESCYWEWVSQFYFDPSYGRNAQALGLALQRGYPAAHLYQRLSEILAAEGKGAESQKAHEEALDNLPRFHLGPHLEMEDIGLPFPPEGKGRLSSAPIR